MSSHQVASNSTKSGVGGAGGIEILGFPQVLFTRTFGDPDMLFAPLLDATREAYTMIDRLSVQGEKRENAVTLGGMHLASSLLKDSSFSLVVKGLSHENMYTVDLSSGVIQVHTRLYAAVGRRASFFKVEIAGKISGGSQFVLRDPVQGTVIMQVSEESLRQPNFFSSSLGQECLKAQIDQERFGRAGTALDSEASGEMRMIVTVGGKKVPVILRQKENAGGCDIIDGLRQEWVGALTPDVESQLKSVTAFVQDLFARR
jgi:hypothetical protein